MDEHGKQRSIGTGPVGPELPVDGFLGVALRGERCQRRPALGHMAVLRQLRDPDVGQRLRAAKSGRPGHVRDHGHDVEQEVRHLWRGPRRWRPRLGHLVARPRVSILGRLDVGARGQRRRERRLAHNNVVPDHAALGGDPAVPDCSVERPCGPVGLQGPRPELPRFRLLYDFRHGDLPRAGQHAIPPGTRPALHDE